MKRLRIKKRVACALDPTNTANFKQDGTQPITPGSVLLFDDQSVSDFCV